jgi:hypothetical protein
MLNDLVLTLVIAAVILAMVLVYIWFSQRKLTANVQRIKQEFKEEYGTPGDHAMVLPPDLESSPDEPPVQAASGDSLTQVDARLRQANQLIHSGENLIRGAQDLTRAVDNRIQAAEACIARLENAAARTQRPGDNPSGDQLPDR